ncbi:tryptophanyl-tRNA synthetase, partial [Apiospora kogelbergensis]|uniref:tryptophanyl-tRNA synthetase n=1 Tax=Apiospora kogelbergensis TaxID=1337665 RepID=UPI0031314D91
ITVDNLLYCLHNSEKTHSLCLSQKMSAKRIFSGIQPTGVPHLGNYLGAMRQWKQLQDEASSSPGTKLFFSIVDLHAITMPQDAPVLRQRRREMMASLLAIGLNPAKSTIFYQSSVPAHSELKWILDCTASVGYLNRMTQWKSKLAEDNNSLRISDETIENKLKMGLFGYPVLQAADILIHRATHVPVGDDQKQHLEFARQCARSFNSTYPGGDMVSPETITTRSPRVMSLTNPHKKMSKSSPNHSSRILITALEDEIRKRIRSAVTDSLYAVTYDPQERPGVSNLLDLLSQCDPEAREPEEWARHFENANLGDLKQATADAVVRELAGVRERYLDFLNHKGGRWLTEIEEEGAKVARESADETMRMVRDVVGLSD